MSDVIRAADDSIVQQIDRRVGDVKEQCLNPEV
jgi:hypothetical protein